MTSESPQIVKPSVGLCATTNHWIVCHFGGKHRCGSDDIEEAFGRFDEALWAANTLAVDRMRRAQHWSGGGLHGE